MDAEADLARLLSTMTPRRREGVFVFTCPPGPLVAAALRVALASVDEDEGVSVVLRAEDADRLGLGHDFRAAWITLTVHSALHAVGLTAAVSAALTEAGISCNVIAGYHHDHLLVPDDRAADALSLLTALAVRAGRTG